MSALFPEVIPNWIDGREQAADDGRSFAKHSPHDGERLCLAARSQATDVDRAVAAACAAKSRWATLTPVRRGEILLDLAMGLRAGSRDIASIVARETGKAPAEALGETGGAVSLGLFFAGEGQRLYGRTTTSGVPHRSAMTVRQALGVAGLIVAANTPIANVAWKVFPALACGNTVVLKAAEDTPATAWIVGAIAREAGLPDGALNIVQGLGPEAGPPLVEHPGVDVISFTGSTAVGRRIAVAAGERLARVSLELGGKNALVVCDDADLDNAVKWAVLSAFSNAGQRCAAASRLVVFDGIYDRFRQRLLEAVDRLAPGPGDEHDLGPVINERQLANMLSAVSEAKSRGAAVLAGGVRLTGPGHVRGCYLAPTVIEGAGPCDPISTAELFGPITCLYRARDLAHALELVNDSPYGLTASIHTASLHRAGVFAREARVGVVSVNAGTYGSEPHMPFGGLKLSGNGSREPGVEALDVYSNLKSVYTTVNPDLA